jgi:phosphoribosylaminoimidazole carboxylase
MLKSRRLAYDGRGNAVAKNEVELTSAVNGRMFFTEVQLLKNPVSYLGLRKATLVLLYAID